MTQEIHGKRIVATPWTKAFWVLFGLMVAGYFTWSGSIQLRMEQHLIHHNALDADVITLKNFAQAGSRFTKTDGDVLVARIVELEKWASADEVKVREVERRLAAMDRKLDLILERLSR